METKDKLLARPGDSVGLAHVASVEDLPRPNRRLEDEKWFHGVLPREDVQRLLVEDGDYLIRESKNRKTNETQYVLSVFWQGHKHFVIQGTEETGWRFEGNAYPTVQDLIIQQHASGLPVTLRSQAILKKPINREDWELLNDQTYVQMKSDNEMETKDKQLARPGDSVGLAHVASVDALSRPNRRLEKEEWFHGVLPREEAQRLLVEDGDYLIRESNNRKTNKTQYVLSVFWQGHKHFVIQGTEETGWRFEGNAYPTVQDLIIQQHASGLPVTLRSQAILKKPINREDWELLNDHIHLEMKIGNGDFCEVYKGLYTPKNMVVSVKTCQDTDQWEDVLQEGLILRQYNHPNIVSFIGIAIQRQPVMIVMEFVPGGALLQFLRKQGKKQTRRQLTQMCVDVANGMAYLENKNCIHRDLAARNCLVGENNVVKISEFGMSREGQEYTVTEGTKQIPIKWTAPEALNFGKYTVMCDVWSFGILMWEIFSGGQQPYPGMTNSQAREQIEKGYRLSQLPNQPDDVYQVMFKCWDYDPDRRPRFQEILDKLTDAVTKL